LPVIEHRQLARQVGDFNEFTLKSSTDFGDMIFPASSTFVFGSKIRIADDDGRLQSQLTEILPPYFRHSCNRDGSTHREVLSTFDF
jgi:hypothetical protein